MDRKWWKVMTKKVATFKGEKYTAVRVENAKKAKAKKGGNSGAGAMHLAAWFGARKIILLGYDCQVGKDGLRHWHDNHDEGLGNAVSLPKFMGQFGETAEYLKDIEIVNCTRATALPYWPLSPLETELAKSH